MNTTDQSSPRRMLRPWAAVVGSLASVALGAMLGTTAYAETEMYHPATTTAGGVVAASTITSITPAGPNTTVCWYGMQGWYTIEATNLTVGGPWASVGRVAASDFSWCATVPNPNATDSFLFRLNQANAFAGTGACAGCHGDKAAEWTGTAHAKAYSTIANLPMPESVKQTCYPCHTVGKGQPTGFIDVATTPHLTDVGCENCHGPAAWHKYSDHDLIRPAVSIDPKICGGCHTDSHHPTYDEYQHTGHAEVLADISIGTATPGVYVPDTLPYSYGVPWAAVTTNRPSVSVTNASGTVITSDTVTTTTTNKASLYGYFITTNANLTLRTNGTTGIIHSGNGPGTGFVYDPGQDRAVGCGICHSAATRMAQLNDYEARLKGRTNAIAFADAHDASEWSATCATCHDPHSDKNPGQMRNPLWSTNYYTMPTTADKRTIVSTSLGGGKTTNVIFMSAAFANMYNPEAQVCGQCHNSRGARWDGRSFGYYIPNADPTKNQSVTTNGPGIVWGVQTNISYARPPHHSPQYNLLSGIIQPDYLNGLTGTKFLGAHSLNTNGCAACHMPTKSVDQPTDEDPNYTGHEFEPLLPGVSAFNGCTVSGCHDGKTTQINATNALADLQLEITNKITSVVGQLNKWAMDRGRALFGPSFDNYQENGWEYTTAGSLAKIATNGPSASDQLKIPAAIRQARFNLYMVAYGQSLGIHNPAYTRYLLQDASDKVAATYPLPTAPVADFTGSPTKIVKGKSVKFSNFSESGLTSFVWDFGDGQATSTAVNPTATYNTAGTFNVTLTGSGSGVPNSTKTRTGYITVVEPPVAAFTASPTTGSKPLTVTFSNTSTGAAAYNWSFGDGWNSTGTNVVYTYSNSGTYTVTLKAINLSVTNTVTQTGLIVIP